MFRASLETGFIWLAFACIVFIYQFTLGEIDLNHIVFAYFLANSLSAVSLYFISLISPINEEFGKNIAGEATNRTSLRPTLLKFSGIGTLVFTNLFFILAFIELDKFEIGVFSQAISVVNGGVALGANFLRSSGWVRIEAKTVNVLFTFIASLCLIFLTALALTIILPTSFNNLLMYVLILSPSYLFIFALDSKLIFALKLDEIERIVRIKLVSLPLIGCSVLVLFAFYDLATSLFIISIMLVLFSLTLFSRK